VTNLLKSDSACANPSEPTAPPSSVIRGTLKVTTRSISLCSTRKRAMKMRTSSGVVRLNFGTCCEPLRTIAEGVSSPLSLGTTVTECTSTDCAELSWATESKWNLMGDKPVKRSNENGRENLT